LAYPYLFSKADTDQLGVLVGEKAVAFVSTRSIASSSQLGQQTLLIFLSLHFLCGQFAHSSLPPTILGEIWQLADQDNAGFLTRHQFDIALRLIGKAQRGLPVNEQAISTPGPLCRLKGFPIPGLPSHSTPPAARPLSSTPLAASQSGQDPLYTISNEDRMKYSSMFIKAGPRDGLLDGDKARDIFIRSKLSFEKLGQIW
jgi:epidermal growth factor receptor substrate 15